MYGLRKINNHYPAGCRGDWIVVGHQEFRHGRSQPLPFMTASLGRPCKKALAVGGRGPRPVSRERVMRMTQGLREPKAEPALARSASDPASRCLATLDRVRREYEHSKKDKLPGLMNLHKKSARGGEAISVTVQVTSASEAQQGKEKAASTQSFIEPPSMGPPSVCTASLPSRPCSAPGSRINTSPDL